MALTGVLKTSYKRRPATHVELTKAGQRHSFRGEPWVPHARELLVTMVAGGRLWICKRRDCLCGDGAAIMICSQSVELTSCHVVLGDALRCPLMSGRVMFFYKMVLAVTSFVTRFVDFLL